MPPFVDFIDEHFGIHDHLFLANGLTDPGIFNCSPYVRPFGRFKHLIPALWNLNRAQIIILHSLFSIKVMLLLLLQPWLLSRCHWVIWGGDLYMHRDLQKTWWGRCWDVIRRQVISRIGGLVTQLKGDVRLARKWYGAKGQWHECFMYPSNLYHEQPTRLAKHDQITILVGNSATVSNNHKQVLDKIACYATGNIKIYCPLSYGDRAYAQEISDYGESIFGNKFMVLRHFMPFEEYINLLAEIDVAIFNHDRQQGMGNTTTLLGMGKKVYMRNNTTLWSFYFGLGVEVFDVDKLDLLPIQGGVAKKNMQLIMNYFSKKNLIAQLKEIFK